MALVSLRCLHLALLLAEPPVAADEGPPPAPQDPPPVESPSGGVDPLAGDAEAPPSVGSPADEPGPTDSRIAPTDDGLAPAPEQPATPETREVEAAGDEDLSMADIFGTAEDHEAVPTAAPPGSAPPGSAPPGSAPPAAAGQRSSFAQRFARSLSFHARIVSSIYHSVHKTTEPEFERNENRVEFRVAYTPNPHVEIVGGIEAVAFGISQVSTLDDLATRQMLRPFHLESDAAYIGLYDLLPNLDIKLGRQIVVWGTADKFNPTNNINPDDLEDRPLFTEPIANQMAVIDYAPLDDRLWFQAVWVPLFFPALLPPSASAALADPQSPVPFAEADELAQIQAAQDLLDIDPGLVPTVTTRVVMPKRRFVDSQAAFKIGTNFGGVFDLSASYYVGRHDIPTPVRATSGFKEEATGEPGTPECCVASEATLVYPRMQVVGLDFATQLPWLGHLGLWGEAALFIPEVHDLRIDFPRPQDVTPENGENNDPVEFVAGPSIESTPFVKATAGLDYTAGKHVYLQAQYLRGFIDEFGASHIGNYLVAGTELSFFGRHLLVRLFQITDFPEDRDDDPSFVVYPAVMAKPPWGYVTLELGSFFLIGKRDTKFGQSATGSSIVFAKVVGEF